MSPPPIKGLLADIDGTLVGSSMRVSPAVMSAVARARGRLAVCLASSRAMEFVLRYARELGLTTPQVCDGGARIFDAGTGRVLVRKALRPDDARLVVATALELRLPFRLVDMDRVVTRLEEVRTWQVTRVSVHDLDRETAVALADRFRDHPSIHASAVMAVDTGRWLVDFTRRDAHKGTALEEVARILGLQPSQMTAVGDSYNDIPMLRTAGLAVAMGNAPDEVKREAHVVAPPVEEDGLAWVLNSLLDGKLGP